MALCWAILIGEGNGYMNKYPWKSKNTVVLRMVVIGVISPKIYTHIPYFIMYHNKDTWIIIRIWANKKNAIISFMTSLEVTKYHK